MNENAGFVIILVAFFAMIAVVAWSSDASDERQRIEAIHSCAAVHGSPIMKDGAYISCAIPGAR